MLVFSGGDIRFYIMTKISRSGELDAHLERFVSFRQIQYYSHLTTHLLDLNNDVSLNPSKVKLDRDYDVYQ